jgi:hypothetical protein
VQDRNEQSRKSGCERENKKTGDQPKHPMRPDGTVCGGDSFAKHSPTPGSSRGGSTARSRPLEEWS